MVSTDAVSMVHGSGRGFDIDKAGRILLVSYNDVAGVPIQRTTPLNAIMGARSLSIVS